MTLRVFAAAAPGTTLQSAAIQNGGTENTSVERLQGDTPPSVGVDFARKAATPKEGGDRTADAAARLEEPSVFYSVFDERLPVLDAHGGLFDGGHVNGEAWVWDPTRLKIVCHGRFKAQSSANIALQSSGGGGAPNATMWGVIDLAAQVHRAIAASVVEVAAPTGKTGKK